MRKSALVAFGLVVTFIVALGLLVLSTASEANGIRLHHDAYFFVKRQFAYLGVGVVIAVATALFDYHKWREYPALTWTFFAVVFVLLLLVFPQLGGRAINGSFRWINLGPLNLQPSEFAKLAAVIVLAVWLDRIGWCVEKFTSGALSCVLLLACLVVPVVLEPDFGSTMVISFAGGLIMIMAGIRLLHLLPFALLGGVGFLGMVLTNANRMARIASFFGKKLAVGAEVADEATIRATHQAKQALVAIGNGGLSGVGLNQSMQKHYYLPEAHTDFIFAIGAEEMGIGFSVLVLCLFVGFFALSVYIARKAADRFGRLLVMGMSFIIFFQAIFNIGVVCKALPTKGMALPFFSYGGTNLMSAFFAVGTILSVGLHSTNDRKRKAFHG